MTAPDPMTRKENIMNSRIKRIFTLSLALLLAVILACGAAAYTNLAKNGDASLGYYEDEDENGFMVPKEWGYWLQDNGKNSLFEIAKGAGPDGSDCFRLYSKNIAHATLISFPGCAPGKTYTVTAYVKYADLEGGAVVIEYYTPEGSPLPTNLSREHGDASNFGGKLDGDSDWKCIWYTFTVPEGADATKTKVQIRIWDGAGDLWFDNFTVTEGDKPAFTEMPDGFTPSTTTETPVTEPPATEPKDTDPVSSSAESTKTPETSGNKASTETPSTATGTADNKPADDNKKGGISPAVIAVICVVAAAVIAGIVAAVVNKKKK